MADLRIREIDGGVVFPVKVLAGSSRTALLGCLSGMVKVKVSAQPQKGKANQCLLDFLAKKLGVKKNAVSIITGQVNPVKQVRVQGVSSQTLMSKLKLNKQRPT